MSNVTTAECGVGIRASGGSAQDANGERAFTIALASDHGGYLLKEAIKTALETEGRHRVIDLGTDSEDAVDYPVFGHKCAELVASGGADRGVVCCGTGIGISMAANKVKGIRCAVVNCDDFAKLAAEHNHANMIGLGGRFVAPEDAMRYIHIWLTAPWAGGRHDRRVAELDEML